MLPYKSFILVLGVREGAENHDYLDLPITARKLNRVLDQMEQDLRVARPVRADIIWNLVHDVKSDLEV